MPVKNRIKISAAYNCFNKEIDRLIKFDFYNQQKFVSNEISKSQIILMVESIFFNGFRSYEAFVREIFLLYCMEKQPLRNSKVVSFLKPRDFSHSEALIKSSMPFLDWNSPETVIDRAELYLMHGHPVKLPYTTNLQALKEFKKIRNHIAHNSIESENEYIKVLKNYFSIIPLKIPEPGEFLMLSSKKKRSNYLLLDFFDLMKKISVDLT